MAEKNTKPSPKDYDRFKGTYGVKVIPAPKKTPKKSK